MTPLLDAAHLPYPHTNGFHHGGERLVLARYSPAVGGTGLSSVRWRGPTTDERPLCELPPSTPGPGGPVWPDVALAAERAAFTWNGTLYVLDLESGTLERLYAAADGHTLQDLCSITAEGDRVVVMEHPLHQRVPVRCLEVSLTGQVRQLFATGWFANHPCHSPHDQSWLAYSHEGPACDVRDRVWAWHPDHAPDGACVYDQGPLAVGHERWMFHDLGAVVCAYGVSEAGPRGLYMVHPDGRGARLVSGGERDWHCDISRDGRWAVVDTTGPHDAPGRGWDNAGHTSDVLLVEVATGTRTVLARTGADSHPRHPHPVFTPDGTSVLYNAGDPATGAVAVAVVPLPSTGRVPTARTTGSGVL
ncbi:hypothetical protein AQ490_16815 [Wenjunlia vitaminophila]|uniref:Oligogalacturonate lyase n=1 Tax=Wenjunlia vitaminophila TaxID=76728 RepID=A0A0T6LYA0_WENVI|nr:hypothetical protein [Wenjunlia vitaminophila]KRV50648.1 hypothetical protein AQ490_16500 [Wenjunlia vitaminophila]KRV50703.1 hypothetical protein AQ490_16815 [Wenjunlia vitaminophila]